MTSKHKQIHPVRDSEHSNGAGTPLKPKVFVAMSGGVDSSVAAGLLKKQGFKVVGVYMKPWSPDSQPTTHNSQQKKSSVVSRQSLVSCMWKQDREDALRAASALDIPFYTWDFSKEYKKEVADYMIREYKAGRTPNPDVMCNKHIKFGLFLDKALKEGADFIATGHYIKIQNAKIKMQNYNEKLRGNLVALRNSKFKIIYKLLQAKDKNKDQSYFLWTLNQKQLKYCLFPIGEYKKPEVRKIAKKFCLPNHDKKDSQGVCFIGPLNMKDFLKKYIKPKPGKIIDPSINSGQVKTVGHHDGVYYYTIGQRHGLNIGNGQGPYFITAKDIKKNIIYVTSQPTTNDLRPTTAIIKEVNWIAEQPKLPMKINVKIRYRSESVPVVLSKFGSNYRATALTGYKLNTITPGQSAVFYRGEEMLGGGIIDLTN